MASHSAAELLPRLVVALLCVWMGAPRKVELYSVAEENAMSSVARSGDPGLSLPVSFDSRPGDDGATSATRPLAAATSTLSRLALPPTLPPMLPAILRAVTGCCQVCRCVRLL